MIPETVPISTVTQPPRNLGDLTPLVESILTRGQIDPIILDEKHHIVSGTRRVAALETLRHTTVHAYIARTTYEAVAILTTECHEARHPMTLWELLALGHRLEALPRPRNAPGRYPDKSLDEIIGPTLPQPMSGTNYYRARFLYRAALYNQEHGETATHLLESVEAGAVSLNEAYKKLHNLTHPTGQQATHPTRPTEPSVFIPSKPGDPTDRATLLTQQLTGLAHAATLIPAGPIPVTPETKRAVTAALRILNRFAKHMEPPPNGY